MWKFLVLLAASLVAMACESGAAGTNVNRDSDSGSENTDSDTAVSDADGDNLPDAWEIAHFGDLDQDGAGDPDDDGISNLTEYERGTNPTVVDYDSDPDTDTSFGDDCADTPWEVDVQPINLLVLLDRSKSMEKNTIGTDTYAKAVQEAIDQIVEQNTRSGIINFALNVFPDAGSCTEAFGELSDLQANDSDSDFAKRCAAASSFTGTGTPGEPTVPFSANVTMDTYQAISSALDTVGQCGGTPICNTLKWARAYLKANPPVGKTFVLLATDGAPSCNAKLTAPACKSSLTDNEDPDTDPQPADRGVQCLDDMCSFNAAFNMAADGFNLFLIGVGDEVAEFQTVLDVLAYYGGAVGDTLIPSNLYDIPDPGTHFYPSSNASEISAAFEDITNSALSCEFEVDWENVPDYDDVAKVQVNKACDKINIYGVPEDDDTDTATTPENVIVNFSADCADEGNKVGWNWADLTVASYNELKLKGDDLTKCTKVRLCPRACEKLKVKSGVKKWNTITAKFGCAAVTID